MGYVTFWLLGKLRLYDGSSHIWKWPVALAPVGGALWIGFTRIQVWPAYSEIRPDVPDDRSADPVPARVTALTAKEPVTSWVG